MRFVVRSYVDKPGKLSARATEIAIEKIALAGNAALVSGSIYRDPYATSDGIGSRVIDKLNKWYFYKCAYCERIYKLDVEHYRPKGEVRDFANAIAQITVGGLLVNHPGYFWLAYEWSNLLPSCITCNREGGKVSRFPVIHHYSYAPIFAAGKLCRLSCLATSVTLSTEEPFLLHPEIDDPVAFFDFVIDPNKKGIRIQGIDPNNRGWYTEEICKLNREEVRYDRVHKVISPIVQMVIAQLSLLQVGRINIYQFRDSVNIYIHKLHLDAADNRLDHTLLRKFIVRTVANFQAIVIPFIPSRVKKILFESFKGYVPL